ncbi:N-acetylmuramoyl-L-alanine amidase [Pelotomaculum propionicicum]|uniref:N-acetylmuramoyl-L-alanine amidase LytC n=1 Tax=Pelotomaculum propionicicum TaxID=258475 RepID=A0A4Y7RWG1_9FIRM|nr:N-acetylmuramoyl-L-alanine amidase [Pelotomaculum propionicicum]TEB13348.1 N-acetylmuramoyl-L-alanine amidase LytC [Pelotomaculum propionicicum]
MKICIDPGHGGYDPGAVGPGGLQEKNVTLAVSLLLAEKLRAAGQEVQLTREGDAGAWDSDGDLWTRCQIANQFGADIFISIHINSAGNPAATGTETYCLALGGEGEQLATAVQQELLATLGLPDRGVKTANYYVLKRTDMPAILTELAFICNPEEEALLASPDFQARAAQAIAQGIGAVYGFATGAAPAPADPNAITIMVMPGEETVTGTLINGTAYAPVRRLAELLGQPVSWNGETRTVVIG